MKSYLFYNDKGDIIQADRHFVDGDLDIRVPDGLFLLEIDSETFENIEGRLEYFYIKRGRVRGRSKETNQKFVQRDKMKGVVK